jgi:hypothetical protein
MLQEKHQAKEKTKRDTNALRQPDEPPALNATFVGKKIEILEEIGARYYRSGQQQREKR